MLLPTSLENLPPYDQAQLDKRFLTELDRLLQANVFTSYKEWAQRLGVPETHVSGIAGGRYHCNLMLLYNTLRFFPATDLAYVLFGAAATGRTEPTAPPVRKKGRPAKQAALSA